MIEGVLHTESQQALSEAVFHYYNNKRIDRNLAQSASDGFVHHHFGVSGTQIEQTTDQQVITNELQRQESVQSDVLLGLLGIEDSAPAHVYDVGCGRGGTMFKLLERHPQATAVGINLTQYQTQFCQQEIVSRGLEQRAQVIQGDFMNPPFGEATFTHAYVNEVTPYAESLDEFFARLNHVLKPGGRVALATWCFNDEKDTSQYWRFLAPICTHYASSMHGIKEYRDALAANGFVVRSEMDTTSQVLDYWHLRLEWKMQSGVEPFFIKAHEADDMRYVFFDLEKK